ncbi:MAG: hypothetical protein EPO35_12495 [Acidobacteria bacterium]|nr:MAG: hypothetical protein EPO35_12495 [Acidobacteriota bacterium]
MKKLAFALLSIVAISCGVTPPTTPVTVLAVSSVSPSTLSTTGGATVTITGSGFGTDTAVTIGGTAVANPTVTSTSVTVTAPVHAAGAGSLVVTTGGKSATSNVTFVAPSGVNAAPVVSNVRVAGPGNRPPSPFVDLASNVTLSGTVTDVETSPASLTYVWAVSAGTVTGSGASVTWNLPASLAVTPVSLTATLTVTETFTENGVQHRNVASSSLLADAHDSSTEIMDKGFRFLDLFSQSTIPPATVVSDFTSTCRGAAEELQDTIDIRNNYLHLSYSITRLPPVEFKFGQSCVWTAFSPIRIYNADACSTFRAHWVVRALRDVADDGVHTGDVVTTDGRDFIGNVFQSGQWKLCTSDFKGDPTSTLLEPSGLTRVIPTPKSLGGRIRRRQ